MSDNAPAKWLGHRSGHERFQVRKRHGSMEADSNRVVQRDIRNAHRFAGVRDQCRPSDQEVLSGSALAESTGHLHRVLET